MNWFATMMSELAGKSMGDEVAAHDRDGHRKKRASRLALAGSRKPSSQRRRKTEYGEISEWDW